MTQVIVTTPQELESLIQDSVKKAFSAQSSQTPIQQTDKLLSITEAAAFLNLSKQTLYGFTSRKEIPFIKKGKKLYFQKSALEAWLREEKLQSSLKETQNN